MNPRRDSAVREIIAHIHDTIGWWGYNPYRLGLRIFYAVYAADKYDVLNKLSKGVKDSINPYIRNNIRKKKLKTLFIELIIIILIIL